MLIEKFIGSILDYFSNGQLSEEERRKRLIVLMISGGLILFIIVVYLTSDRLGQ